MSIPISECKLPRSGLLEQFAARERKKSAPREQQR